MLFASLRIDVDAEGDLAVATVGADGVDGVATAVIAPARSAALTTIW